MTPKSPSTRARWLLEAHTARSDGLISRAVALLGFIGLVLALLLQGSALKGIDPSWWTWSFLIAAVVFMVISAWLSLRTISPKQTALPGVNDLTDWREQHLRKPQPGTAGPQVAESLLLNHYVPDTRGMHGGFDSKGWPASTS